MKYIKLLVGLSIFVPSFVFKCVLIWKMIPDYHMVTIVSGLGVGIILAGLSEVKKS